MLAPDDAVESGSAPDTVTGPIAIITVAEGTEYEYSTFNIAGWDVDPDTLVDIAEDSRGRANRAALDATQSWLIGVGLATEIDRTRFPDGSPSIPAPSLEGILDALGQVAGHACNKADVVATLLGEGNDPTSSVVTKAVAQVEEFQQRAALLTRRIGQLTLGVTTHREWNDAVARLERAAVGVLRPSTSPWPALTDDGVEFSSRSFEEFRTELAGALCRMIIDHDCQLELTSDTGTVVTFVVDSVGNLSAKFRSQGPEVPDRAQLSGLGWAVDGAAVTASWRDPLSVIEPASLAMTTFRQAPGINSPDQISADVAVVR